MKQSNLQQNCIKFCKSEGLFHINTRGVKAPSNYPDLIICLNGMFIAFAFTDSTEQRLHCKKVLSCGGRIYRPRTLGEFVEIIRSIQEEKKNEF